MPSFSWPKRGTTSLIGHETDRTDGVAKASGTAKYSYDINPGAGGGIRVLTAKALGCPHAHCKLKSIDISAAEKVPGVVGVFTMKKPDDEIFWQGDLLAVVVAETEGAAIEGRAAIKPDFEMLDICVEDRDLQAAEAAGRVVPGGTTQQVANEPGDDVEDEDAYYEQELERLFKEASCVVEGTYGVEVITHMCLEPHGSTCEWNDGKLTAHLSTQNVSGTAAQFAMPLGITADDVTVHCDFIGGGFGSKFAPDSWGVLCAEISRTLKRPVRLMLDRDLELKNAGCRPSIFVKAKLGADSNGKVTVWDSTQWGTSGNAPGGNVQAGIVPYVFAPPNRRSKQFTINTNTGPYRAWRAPGHPQACAVSQTAYDDLAAKLRMDSYDLFLANLDTVTNGKADVYKAEMEIAAKLIDWKGKWHLHGEGPKKGSIKSGLGMAIHTWGGGPGPSSCAVKVHPDGGVEVSLGSQDLGTGTRTVIGMVVAETFGLPLEAVKVHIGSSKLPASGPSGGSITVGGVSSSTRIAAQKAFEKLAELVGKKLKVEPATLVAKSGRIQVEGQPDKSLGWREACSLLGMNALETQGNKDEAPNLASSQVGGVQMAEVEVDVDTGVIRMKKFVAVQDMGLIINPQCAKSQIYGALIMGIAYALTEQRIMDRATGAFVNAELADYKLPRLGDIGELVVELYQPDSEYERGVVGLGEPPVISPGAAISNAVANALGVRVPTLPLTPDAVLRALGKG